MAKKVTHLVNPDGDVVKVNAEDAAGLVQQGFVPASEEQTKAAQLEERYGGTGQAIAAGAEHAADVGTFGLSTAAETAFGVPSEDIQGREEAHPLASAIGTGVGIVAPALISGGTSALAQGAEHTAPALIAKAGHAASGVVERALPEATSVLGKVARKAAISGAGAATESALFVAGHVVHEAALGDPNLTAQSAMEEIGLSGLLGGGLGIVTGGVGSALGQLAEKASGGQLGEKVAGWLGDFEGERNAKAAGAIQSDINRALKTNSREDLNAMMREARDMGLIDTFTTPAGALDRVKEMKPGVGKAMDSFLSDADASATDLPSANRLLSRARNEALAPLKSNPMQRQAASMLEADISAYENKLGATEAGAKMSFKDMHEIRQQLDESIFGMQGNRDPYAKAYTKGLLKVRRLLNDELEDGLQANGIDSTPWKEANRQWKVLSTVEKFAKSGMSRAHGNNMVSPMEFLGGLTGMLHGGPMGAAAMGAGTAVARRFASGALGTGARVLRDYLSSGAAEEVAGGTAEAIAAARKAGADNLTQGATQQAESVAAMAALKEANEKVAARVDKAAEALVHGAKAAAKAGRAEALHAISDEVFQQRVQRIQQLTDPQTLQQHLVDSTQDMHEHTPDVAQAYSTATVQSLNVLRKVLPKAPKLGPLGPTLKPSKSEKADFNRAWQVLDKPTRLLEKAAAGNLHPMDVQVLKAARPHALQQIQRSVMDKVSKHKGTLPYRTKLMLSMLMEQPLDGTASPHAILANQAVYAMPSAKSGQDATGPGALGKTTQGGLAKLEVAGRAQLPGQAAESRRREAV